MWRYFPDEDELRAINNGRSTLHPHLQDQRWRFIAQDLEMGMGIWTTGENTNFATGSHFNNIGALMTRGGILGGGGHYGANLNSFMMRALLGGGAMGTGSNAQPAIAGRPEARAKLANALSDLMDGAYAANNANAVHGRIAWLIGAEHRIMLQRDGTNPSVNRRIAEVHRAATVHGNIARYVWPSWDGSDGIGQEHTNITNFFTRRGEAILGHIARSPTATTASQATSTNHGPDAGLGLSSTARNNTITMSVSGAGHGIMNTRPVGVQGLAWSGTTGAANNVPVFDARAHGRRGERDDNRIAESVTGRYWAGAPIPITAVPTPGFRAVWSGSGYTIPPVGTTRIEVQGSPTIHITFERCPIFMARGNLDIGTVKAESFNSGANDWVELNNHTGRAVSTKGLYLTDSNGDDWKWQMPSFIIPAGGSLRVRTDGNDESSRFLKRARTNFNLGFGERLRLTDALGNVIVRVEVGIMRPDQVQHRDAWTDGNFRIRRLGPDNNPMLGGEAENPGMGFAVGHGPPCDVCGSPMDACDCPCPGGCGFPGRDCRCPCPRCTRFPCACCRRCNEAVCICPPSFFIDGGIATHEIVRDGSVHVAGRDVPNFRVTIHVTMNEDVTNWDLTAALPAGTLLHPHNSVVINMRGRQLNNHWGANISLTGGNLSIGGQDRGNQDTFHRVSAGETFSVILQITNPDPEFELF
jgi:hypothetical protein